MISVLGITFLTFCAAPSLVRGHITATVPPAGAVYQGDETQIFKWVYDTVDLDGNPFVKERFRCDLMWGNNHWVAMLARNLSIYDGAVRVYIRSDYGFDSSGYYIRYTTDDSKSSATSERFTLANMRGTNHSQVFEEYDGYGATSHGAGGVPANSNPNSGVSSAAPGSYIPLSRTSGSPSLMTSKLLTKNSVSASATYLTDSSTTTRAGEPIGPYGILPTPSAIGRSDDGDNRSGAMSLSRQTDSTLQKVSLVLWPVMVGAMMAI